MPPYVVVAILTIVFLLFTLLVLLALGASEFITRTLGMPRLDRVRYHAKVVFAFAGVFWTAVAAVAATASAMR